MKFEAHRDTMLTVMKIVSGTVPKRTTLPVLQTVRLEVTEEHELFAMTTTTEATTYYDAGDIDGIEPGVALVDHHALYELLKRFPPAEISFSISGSSLMLKAGRIEYKVNLFGDVDEFPLPPAIDYSVVIEMRIEELSDLFQRVSWARSTEPSRPILNGILWSLSKKQLSMIATSGFVLAKVNYPAKLDVADEFDVIVTEAGVMGAIRAMPDSGEVTIRMGRYTNENGGPDSVDHALRHTVIEFEHDGIRTVSRTIEGPYPNYNQVIPEDAPLIWEASRVVTVAALNRLMAIASDDTHRVALQLGAAEKPPEPPAAKGRGKNKITEPARDMFACGDMTAITPDRGRGTEPADGTYTGEPIRIGINASYMLDGLDAFNTSRFRAELTHPDRAIIVRPIIARDEKERDMLVLVMPLRLLD